MNLSRLTIPERARRRGQGGFTLIELLVVIAILGVLAGVVVFAVGGISNNSQQSACRLEARTIRTAIGAFNAQNNSWPTGYGSLVQGLLQTTPNANNVSVSFPGAGTAPIFTWGSTCNAVSGGNLP